MARRSAFAARGSARAARAFVVVAVAMLVGLPAAGADAPTPPPGPPILYWPPATSPVLENAPGGVWQAPPIMVSGASAYRDGEFLYQDYLYDDVGSYPSGGQYAGNAADFVEIRVKPLADATAVRITYNTMVDPNVVATTIALGDSATAYPMPHGANTVSPGQIFVTVHGSSGDIVDAASGATETARPTVATDVTRHQTDVRIPYGAFDPRGRVVRIAAGTGVWSAAGNSYLQKASTLPANLASSVPSGTPVSQGSNFYNVAFRYHESGDLYAAAETTALQNGDISAFFAPVDFGKLASGVDDDLDGVSGSATTPGGSPTHGWRARILVSHYQFGQGRGTASSCSEPCNPTFDLPGQLLPYNLYVPAAPMAPQGYGVTLDLHNCSLDYTSLQHPEFGERRQPSLIISPSGRGSCNWYWGAAGAEAFEDWADAGTHYKLDPGYADVAGGSGGGYGTYKFISQFPDLFAAAVPIVGCPTAGVAWEDPSLPDSGGAAAEIRNLVASWRHVALMSLNGRFDELCGNVSQEYIRLALEATGYPYIWRDYTSEHELDCENQSGICATQLPYWLDYAEMAAFMGDHHVDPNPAHVTYVYNPGMSQPQWGMTSDHAYWVSGLKLASNTGTPPLGTIDVFSHGFGQGDPQPGTALPGAGASPMPYYSWTKTNGPDATVPVADQLDVTATNISQVTIDAARARVDCDARINLTSSTPVQARLVDCP